MLDTGYEAQIKELLVINRNLRDTLKESQKNMEIPAE